MTPRLVLLGPDEQVVPKDSIGQFKMRAAGREAASKAQRDFDTPLPPSLPGLVYNAMLSAAPSPQYAEVTEEMIEEGARIIYEQDASSLDIPWEHLAPDSFHRRLCVRQFIAAVQFLSNKLSQKSEKQDG